jgi:hypothetical protein
MVRPAFFAPLQCSRRRKLNATCEGVSNLLSFSLTVGCPVIIQTRFEPVSFCANIEKYKIAFAFIVPPVLVVLARHPGASNYHYQKWFQN